MFSNFGRTISRPRLRTLSRPPAGLGLWLEFRLPQQLGYLESLIQGASGSGRGKGKRQRNLTPSSRFKASAILRTRNIRNMSTFRLTGKELGFGESEKGMEDLNVEIKLKDGVTKEELLEFPAFKNWTSRLSTSLTLQHTSKSHPFHSSPYSLKSIEITSTTVFPYPKPHVGFLTLDARIEDQRGEVLPGSIFLRGMSVGMLVVLQPDDVPKESEDEKWVIMTIQPRPAAGSLAFCELPAGMVDGSDGQVKGAAAREIREEVDLIIEESDLINLSELALSSSSSSPEEAENLPKAMFPSAGGCDEFIPLFLYEKRVKRESLKEWKGKLTGLREEGEKITLKLVRLEDLWREGSRDAKALGAWALYEGLKRVGKL